MKDGFARLLLAIIAATLVGLLLLELGWLPRPAAAPAAEAAGRYQFSAARYGPLGNFLVRFDTATGKLERVRFPASNVVWEEVGVLPPGSKAKPDPLQATGPPLPGGLVLPGNLLQQAPAPTPEPGAPARPGGGAGTP